ncbi:MAG: glycoside hydrolase family 75 protein [Myxococcales bacterium]|nr:glycoside hydrolase family 75 protein [Myxococcales bacterium]
MKLSIGLALAISLLVREDPGVGGSGAERADEGPRRAGPSADELLALTESCDPLPGVGKFKTDSRSPATVPICRLNGAIWWRADADIDCDGGTSASCKDDPSYQATTSAKDSKGSFVDASTLPFLVVPLAGNGFDPKKLGIKTGWSGYGSAGAIIYDGQLLYVPYADAGPAGVIGELSQAAAARLGIPTSPRSGGVDSGVTYIVFTGPGSYVEPIESEAEARALGERLARALIQDN